MATTLFVALVALVACALAASTLPPTPASYIVCELTSMLNLYIFIDYLPSSIPDRLIGVT